MHDETLKFIKIRPVGSALFHSDRWTEKTELLAMLQTRLKYVIIPVLGYSTISEFTPRCTAMTLFSYGRSITFGASLCPFCYSHAYTEEGGNSSLRNAGDRPQEYTLSQLLKSLNTSATCSLWATPAIRDCVYLENQVSAK